MKELKVSICVPVYGVENYIERCARSVFEQSYDNIEFVFVNDQTPDRSWDVLQSVIEDYPERKPQVVTYTHDINRGLAEVRNTAVRIASGDYILWVDSDDYIENNAVEECVKCASKEKSDIVFFNYLIEKPHYFQQVRITRVQSPKERTLSVLSRMVPPCIWCGMINRHLYVDHQITAWGG